MPENITRILYGTLVVGAVIFAWLNAYTNSTPFTVSLIYSFAGIGIGTTFAKILFG